MIDSLLQSVKKISGIDKKQHQIDERIQTYDKVTTYPYGTSAIKVCESEMLSNNKLNRLDEDKHTPKDKDKDNSIPKTKTKTNTIPKTKTIHKTIVKIEDKDKITPKAIVDIKYKDKDKDKDKIKDKSKDKDKDKDKNKNKYDNKHFIM